MPASHSPHSPGRQAQARAGTQPGAGPGPDCYLGPDVDLDLEVTQVAPSLVIDPPRYVIRFLFPWDDGAGPRYATQHPDPPHDWAFTDLFALASALSFDQYADAARVLDYDYGRRRIGHQAQGHHGSVVILAEEIHDLTYWAQAAMTELRAR